jgi:hypothetical protein
MRSIHLHHFGAMLRIFWMVIFWGSWSYPLLGQDSTGINNTVRIVRPFDPNLPEWFRISSDPILILEPSTRIPMAYKADSLSFVQSFAPIPKYREPSLAIVTLQPQWVNRASVALGGLPGGQGNLAGEWSAPWRLGKETFFGKLDFKGASGNSKGLWADSIQSLAIWNSHINMRWRPAGNRDWQVSLDATQRSSPFKFKRVLIPATDSTSARDTMSRLQWNNWRFNPRISWDGVSQRLDGLHQHLLMEGFGTRIGNSAESASHPGDLGTEWAGIMAYQIGYSGDEHDLSLKVNWSNSAFVSGTSDTLSRSRSTLSFGPAWVRNFGQSRWNASVQVIRQREFSESSNASRTSWIMLPQLSWQYRKSHPTARGLQDAHTVELGITSGIFQPSLYHWSSLYPTLSQLDDYQASIQRAEGFARIQHGGLTGLHWQHRVGIGSWTNPRFFGLDSNSVMGVVAGTLPKATQWSWETKVSVIDQGPMQCTLSTGMQGIIVERSWIGMPGLQPVFWGTFQLARPLSQTWKFELQSTVYCIESKRLIHKNISDESSDLKLPVNMDFTMTKAISKKSAVALIFRQRHAAPWLLWAEDVWWGRFFQVEWRWKI